VSSPDATCGQLSQNLDITAEVENQGDLRVGPGIMLTYYGEWTGLGLTQALYADAQGTPLTATLLTSLDPGDSILVSASYSALFNAPQVVPDKVRVVVDESNQALECLEQNNELTTMVDPGMLLADLVVDLGMPDASACPMPTVPTTVTNLGSAPAANIVVRYYAGDPNQGGTPLTDAVVAGPLGPNEAFSFIAVIPMLPSSLPTLIYAVVDPDDLIPECKDGNNKGVATQKVTCSQVN
jgi:subtilase family serine protease